MFLLTLLKDFSTYDKIYEGTKVVWIRVVIKYNIYLIGLIKIKNIMPFDIIYNFHDSKPS